jgi:hypothetical protein
MLPRAEFLISHADDAQPPRLRARMFFLPVAHVDTTCSMFRAWRPARGTRVATRKAIMSEPAARPRLATKKCELGAGPRQRGSGRWRRHFHQWAAPHAGTLTPARTAVALSRDVRRMSGERCHRPGRHPAPRTPPLSEAVLVSMGEVRRGGISIFKKNCPGSLKRLADPCFHLHSERETRIACPRSL